MQSIFESTDAALYDHFACTLQFRDRLVAGVPSGGKLIEAWILRNMGMTRREEVENLTIQTLREIGVDVDELFPGEEPTFATLQEAAEAIAKKSQTTVFKRDPETGLYIESRQVKAMLRESANILWPGNSGKWGAKAVANAKGETRIQGGKIARNYLIEVISIEPLHIPIGVSEPTGIDLAVQHIIDRNGPRSALSYYEYVDGPQISFVIKVLKNRLENEIWAQLWTYAQQHGLGAKRSQDFGRFVVTRWDLVSADEARALMTQRTNGRWVEDYVRAAAREHGIDPDLAVRVANGEPGTGSRARHKADSHEDL